MELIIKHPGDPPHSVALRGEELTIGRDKSCDILLASRFVSRQHARLELRSDGYVISDLGSRNGTFVNGQRLRKDERRPLTKVDEAAIADFLLTCSEAPDGDTTGTYQGVAQEALRVDLSAHEVWLGQRRLETHLSVQEFRLLALLYENEGKVCSHEAIGEHVWGGEVVEGQSLAAYDSNMLHRLVFRLKAKLEKGFGAGGCVVNVPGVGYKLG